MACPNKNDEQYAALTAHFAGEGMDAVQAEHAAHLAWMRHGEKMPSVEEARGHLNAQSAPPVAAPGGAFTPTEQALIDHATARTSWQRQRDIKDRPDVFQFRRSTYPDIMQWDAKRAGDIATWTDTKGEIGEQGTQYVVDGHHRLFSARALNVPILHVEHVPEGMSAAEARSWAALRNIAISPNLDTVDVAHFLRETGLPHEQLIPMLNEHGINTSGRQQRLLGDALGLTKLPAEIFDPMFKMNDPTATKAAVEIGKSAYDTRDQVSLWKDVQKDVEAGKEINTRRIRAQADALNVARGASGGFDFGDDSQEVAKARGSLVETINRSIQTVVRESNKSGFTQEFYDTTEGQKKLTGIIQQVKELVKQGAGLTTPAGKIISRGVEDIRNGKPEREVAHDIIRQLWTPDFIDQTVNAGRVEAGTGGVGRVAEAAPADGEGSGSGTAGTVNAADDLSDIPQDVMDLFSDEPDPRDAQPEVRHARIDHTTGLPTSRPPLTGAVMVGMDKGHGAAAPLVNALTNARESVGSAAVNAVSVVDDALRAVAPASRGNGADMAANITRAHLGIEARAKAMAFDALNKFRRALDRLPEAKRLTIIYNMERGLPQETPQLAGIVGKMRKALDAKAAEVQALGTGKLENLIDNYLGHLWKDPDGADVKTFLRSISQRRPLHGNKAFLKHRSIPTIYDGMRWRVYDEQGAFVSSHDTERQAQSALDTLPVSDEGDGETVGRIGKPLKPVTTNPVELTLLKLNEMQKYIMGTHIVNELKANGLLKFQNNIYEIPDGWAKINDAFATVHAPRTDTGATAIQGIYIAPDQVATVLNNYLMPGLHGTPLYDALKAPNNILNQVQLAGGYHLGITAFNNIISSAALAIKRGEGAIRMGAESARAASSGQSTQAAFYASRMVNHLRAGAGNLFDAATAWSVVNTVRKGLQLRDAYLHPDTVPAMRAFMADVLAQGGARIGLDNVYHNNSIEGFLNALDTRDYVKAPVLAPFAALQAIAKPTMEYAVPLSKLGAASEMAQYELDRAYDRTGETATPEKMRAAMQRAWQSVDNRFGQMTYDNLFWHRTLKDMLQLTLRSIGWNGGSLMEGGGAAIDTIMTAKRVNNGGDAVTHRMAYAATLPAVMALYGAIFMYLYTGHGPKTLKDYYAPENGHMNPDGSPQRVFLPSYMKDVQTLASDVNTDEHGHVQVGDTVKNMLDTVGHKTSPELSAVIAMLQNKDYYGTEIRNSDSPTMQQAKSLAAYMGKQFLPFAVTNEQRFADAGASTIDKVSAAFGIAPAPASTYQTAAMKEAIKYLNAHMQQGARTQAEADKSKAHHDALTAMRAAIRTGDTKSAAAQYQQYEKAHDKTAATALTKESMLTPLAAIVENTRVPLDAALRIYAKATPTERALRMSTKYALAGSLRDVVRTKAYHMATSPDAATRAQFPAYVSRLRALGVMPNLSHVPQHGHGRRGGMSLRLPSLHR